MRYNEKIINIGLAAGFAALGIGLGVLYSVLVIRHYPENKRRSASVGAVIFFFVVTVALFGIISIRSFAISKVNEYSARLEQYVKDAYANIDLVKNGIDLNELNNNLSGVNNTVNDLTTILPSHTELGIDKFVYDLILNAVTKELQRNLAVINYSAGKVNLFADDGNMLTVSSLINGFRTSIIKLVNINAIIVAAVFIIPFLIYIIHTLKAAKKEKTANTTQR
jgi:hypothetical protein